MLRKRSLRSAHPTALAVLVATTTLLLACTQERLPSPRADKSITNAKHPNPVALVEELAVVGQAATADSNTVMLKQRVMASAVLHDQVSMPIPLPATQGDNYVGIDSNPITRVSDQPVSTFGLDVDTGSYAVVRRHITHGQLPPADAVRTEELINYFNYGTGHSADSIHPFALHTELATAPWHPERYLLRIGVDAAQESRDNLPSANLVFLIDVSGSMNAPDKLPLLKSAMRLLTRKLDGDDRVTIVTYAGHTAVALEPTPGNEASEIHAAIAQLGAGGGTHGSAGLREAYRLARSAFIPDGINRVMLATDGDFNVGETDHDALIDLIESQRDSGVALSTIGFGQGNYNDHLMEQLADHGNGNYAYIDSLREARKVLDQQLGATLFTVAHDAKIQVEFNPATVAEYRLIGYENRALREQDFNNDRVDAGDIGAGHTVTALYEIALVGSEGAQLPTRRFSGTTPVTAIDTTSLADVRLRYKRAHDDASELMTRLIDRADAVDQPSEHLRFAASVAAWGDWLRDGEVGHQFGPKAITALARGALGADTHGYRREFIDLVSLSQALKGQS